MSTCCFTLPNGAATTLTSAIAISDEIEEELAPLTAALEPPVVETYTDLLNKARKATGAVSWVRVLGKYTTQGLFTHITTAKK